MIAIANGEISNRTLENSISSETLDILKINLIIMKKVW